MLSLKNFITSDIVSSTCMYKVIAWCMLWGSPHGLLAAGPLSKGQHLLSVNTNDKDGLDVEGLRRNQKKTA